MTELEKIISTLKQIIPELEETGAKDVTEPGLYLYLNAVHPLAGNKDIVTVQIIAACNSLDGVIPVIHTVRTRVKQVEEQLDGMVTFKGAYTEDSRQSLYVYTLTFEAEIFNEFLPGGFLSEIGVQ